MPIWCKALQPGTEYDRICRFRCGRPHNARSCATRRQPERAAFVVKGNAYGHGSRAGARGRTICAASLRLYAFKKRLHCATAALARRSRAWTGAAWIALDDMAAETRNPYVVGYRLEFT